MLWQIIHHSTIVTITLIVTLTLTKIIKRSIEKYLPKANTHTIFLKNLLVGIIYFLGCVMALSTIPSFEGIAYSLLASSGMLALIAGFASQQIFSNMVSGILIAVTKPFEINDYIKVGIKVGETAEGTVEDITLRHTILRSAQGNRVIVPNSYLNNQIIEKKA